MSMSYDSVKKPGWQPPVQKKGGGAKPGLAFPQQHVTPTSSEKVATPSLMGGMMENVTRSMMSPSAEGLTVQAKLTIGEPGDKYEQEADKVASEVVQRINAPSEGLIKAPPRQDGRQARVQRKIEIASRVQRKEGIVSGAASSEFEQGVNRARAGGSPLDAAFRAKVEPVMGADFSGVRVHTDGAADELSRSIQAKAFTTGQDVFFRRGAYEPGSRGGQELLAHELTHVKQQKGGAIQRMKEFEYDRKVYKTPEQVKNQLKRCVKERRLLDFSELYAKLVDHAIKNKEYLKMDLLTIWQELEMVSDEEYNEMLTLEKKREEVEFKKERNLTWRQIAEAYILIKQIKERYPNQRLIYVGGSVSIIGMVNEILGKEEVFYLPLSGTKAARVDKSLCKLLQDNRTRLEAVCRVYLGNKIDINSAVLVDYTMTGGGLKWAQAVVAAYGFWKHDDEKKVNQKTFEKYMEDGDNHIKCVALSSSGGKTDLWGRPMYTLKLNKSAELGKLFDDEFKKSYRWIGKYDIKYEGDLQVDDRSKLMDIVWKDLIAQEIKNLWDEGGGVSSEVLSPVEDVTFQQKQTEIKQGGSQLTERQKRLIEFKKKRKKEMRQQEEQKEGNESV